MQAKRPETAAATLPVLFRAEKSGPLKGEVIAVFPTLPATYQNDMTCYTHHGQHTACSYRWLREKTRPATKEEYGPLLEELWGIYCHPDDPPVNLRVYRKIQAWMDEERLSC